MANKQTVTKYRDNYIINDYRGTKITLKKHNTIGDGRCYFAAVFGAIYGIDYNFTTDEKQNDILSNDLNYKIKNFINCLDRKKTTQYKNANSSYQALPEKDRNFNTFYEYYHSLNIPNSQGSYEWAEGDILNPLMELCFNKKIYIIIDHEEGIRLHKDVDFNDLKNNIYIWYNGRDHYERMSVTRNVFDSSCSSTAVTTPIKKSNVNSYQHYSEKVTTSTSGKYRLNCITNGIGTVTFTISSDDGKTRYLTFTLQLLYNEDIVYAFGNNNVLKINELNKCIGENRTVNLKQYYYINGNEWSNYFEVVLTVDKTENILYAQVNNNRCIKKIEKTEKHTEFIPFDRIDNKMVNIGSSVKTPVGSPDRNYTKTPDNSQLQYDESQYSNVSPNKLEALGKIGNLSSYVNEIVMNPNHNINGLTSITKRYYSDDSDDKQFPQVKHTFESLIKTQLGNQNIPIKTQIVNKNQTHEMNKKRQTTKAKCDCIDIRHDIRTILEENDAIKKLNSNIPKEPLLNTSLLNPNDVGQHKLLQAAQSVLESVQTEMSNDGYIFEKIPPTVQQTKFQVFTDFVADVIIKAYQSNIDIVHIEPFIYEESGRGLNFENFRKFYNKQLKDNSGDRELFYSNLYETLINRINFKDINEINSYVNKILSAGGNSTTVKKSKVQQIDACKIGRTQEDEEPKSVGTVREVFGCLNVEITYKGLNNNSKNTYSVKIKNLNGDLLMTCSVTQDIPLNDVSNYLNTHFNKLLLDGKLADTRGDDCGDETDGGSGGSFTETEPVFKEKCDDSVKALCIEALKTVCDKLYKLSGSAVKKISTIDDLVRVDPRVDYLFGEIDECPDVYRSFVDGFFVYGGTTTKNDYSDIFYRNYVFICFLSNCSAHLQNMDITTVKNLTTDTKIRSNRLINYIERLRLIRSSFCDQLDNNSSAIYTEFERWMIQIICCELMDKIRKINNYISNVNNILSKKLNFSEFYRSIIGLDNLEQLLTMSSLNFYYSNEDNIFNPDKINIPENNCSDYGFSGDWVSSNIQKEKRNTVDENSVDELFDKVTNVETVNNETKITFSSNVKQSKVKKELLELLDKDEGVIKYDKSTSNQGVQVKSPTLTTSTNLELLFKLLHFLNVSKQEKRDDGKSDRITRSSTSSDEKNVLPTSLKERIIQQIIDVTTDFTTQIGINCQEKKLITDLNNIISNPYSKPKQLDLNNSTHTSPNSVSTSSVSKENSPYKKTVSNGESTDVSKDINQSKTPISTSNKRNRQDVSNSTDTPDSKHNPRYMESTDSSRRRQQSAAQQNSNDTKRKRIWKGGNKTVTRRKNKNLPKRKTIKKRKIQKRNTKTRRNK